MSDDPTMPHPPTGEAQPNEPGLVAPVPPVPPPFQYEGSTTGEFNVVEQTPMVEPLPPEPLPTEPLPTVATPTEPLPTLVPPPPAPMAEPVGGYGITAEPTPAVTSAPAKSGKGKRIGIMAGAAVVALGLGAGGGYLARGGEVDDLTSERDELIIERNDLSAERTALTEARDSLDTKLAATEAERDQLESELSEMTADLEEMEAAAAAAGESVGACRDAAAMATTIGDQWFEIWDLEGQWLQTEVGSPEEAELDQQISDAFDKLDELYFDLEDLSEACEASA